MIDGVASLLAHRWPRLSKKEKRKDPPAEVISDLARALTHPLRVRILEGLVGGSASPKTLAKNLHAPLSNVAYHVRVLHKDCEVIELVSTRKVRAVEESFYRLKPQTDFRAVDWFLVPPSLLNELRGSLLQSFLGISIAALGSGSMNDSDETTFTWLPITVDQAGLAEANEAMRQALEKIEGIEAKSRRRVEQGEPDSAISAVIGAAAFRAAPPPGGEDKHGNA